MPRWILLIVSSLFLAACSGGPRDHAALPEGTKPEPVPPASEPGAVVHGTSHEGRPRVVRTHGQGLARVLVIGLIHGDEPEAFARFDDLWLRLTTAGYGNEVSLAGIESMNPDGFERGSRGNARGVDLNRNWPAGNFRPSRRRGAAPLTAPETAAVHDFIMRFKPHVIVVFHSASSGPFVDPDGPEPMSIDLADAFVRSASRVNPAWHTRPDFTNPPGSLGTWYGLDEGRIVLTVEFLRGTDPVEALSVSTAGTLAVLRSIARDQLSSSP